MSQEMLKIPILDMSLKIPPLRLQRHLPGTNELMQGLLGAFLESYGMTIVSSKCDLHLKFTIATSYAMLQLIML